jgi:hypothetical protein
LAGEHFKVFDIKDTVYGPKNGYLLESLLSGFSFKYNLCASSEMNGCLGFGLKAPCGSKKSDREKFVVGACIQLLLHGSGTWFAQEPKKVVKKLKAHRKAGIVKDPHAIEVLEVLNFFFIVKETY